MTRELRKRLHQVDPNLKIIPGGVRRVKHSSIGVKDWEMAEGVECPRCKGETLRLVDGLCPQCWGNDEAERARDVEAKSMRRYYERRLREGTISLAQMREGRL